MLPFSTTLDHVGLLSQSAEDAALLLSCLIGPDKTDPGSDTPKDLNASPNDADLSGKRVGIIPQFLDNCEPVVAKNFERSVTLFRELGAKVEPCPILDGLSIPQAIVAYDFYASHKDIYRDKPDEFGNRVGRMLKRSSKVTPERYWQGLTERQALEDRVSKRMAEWDYLIGPTSPAIAERIGDEKGPDRRSQNTIWFNLTRQPAIAIPNGFSDGQPTSLTIAGRKYADSDVLAVARLIQSHTDYHRKRPTGL